MVEQDAVPDYAVSNLSESNTSTRWLMGAVLLLAVITVWKLPFWLAHGNGDQREYFLPWLNHILRAGRLHGLEASFANYNPPYIYVLCTASLLSGVVPALAVVKLTNLPFLVLAATTVYVTCRAVGCSLLRASLGAALVLVAPEVVQNAWSWGQCDVIYSSFLLVFLSAVHFKKPALGMICFALALSFKLQAIFLGPVIVLLLLAGEIPLWTVALVPVVYAAMLLPAILAGRPPASILMVYGSQYSFYNNLAYGVVNPYKLITHWSDLRGLNEPLKRVGLLVCTVCNCVFLWFVWSRRKALRSLHGILVAASLCVMLEVYTLPKMHERYFYPADLLLLMLVALNPRRYWLAAATMQLVSLFAYSAFLYDTTSNNILFGVLVLMVGATIWFLVKDFGRLAAEGSVDAIKG